MGCIFCISIISVFVYILFWWTNLTDVLSYSELELEGRMYMEEKTSVVMKERKYDIASRALVVDVRAEARDQLIMELMFDNGAVLYKNLYRILQQLYGFKSVTTKNRDYIIKKAFEGKVVMVRDRKIIGLGRMLADLRLK